MKNENGIKTDISCETKEEATLLDYLIVILKHKRLVIFCILIATVIAVSHISYTKLKSSRISAAPAPAAPTPPPASAIFRSICTITLGDLDGYGIIAMLKKVELSQIIILRNNLLPLLFPQYWDEKSTNWVSGKPPSLRDGYNQLQSSLVIRSIDSSNEMELSYEDTNAERAQKILNYIIEGAKEYLEQKFHEKQKKALEMINLKKQYISQQLASTSDPALKAALANHLANSMSEEFFEKNKKYQVFKVIYLSSSIEMKPPPQITSASKPPEKPVMKVSSSMKPANLILISIFLALITGIILSFFVEYIKSFKEKYPEKVKDLCFWSKFR